MKPFFTAAQNDFRDLISLEPVLLYAEIAMRFVYLQNKRTKKIILFFQVESISVAFRLSHFR